MTRTTQWVYFRAVVLNPSPGDPLLCTFCMSPLFNTPDWDNQLVRRESHELNERADDLNHQEKTPWGSWTEAPGETELMRVFSPLTETDWNPSELHFIQTPCCTTQNRPSPHDFKSSLYFGICVNKSLSGINSATTVSVLSFISLHMDFAATLEYMLDMYEHTNDRFIIGMYVKKKENLTAHKYFYYNKQLKDYFLILY